MASEKTIPPAQPARSRDWKRVFRFDLGTLVCFILAINFILYANWQLRHGYRVVVETSEEKRVVLRPKYEVGWPWRFIKLNGIQKRVMTNTAADSEPMIEIMSWPDAVKTLTVNVLLVGVLTILFVWLKAALFAERTRRAPAQRTLRKIPPEFV